ncbi:hypothetical protein ABZ816_27740 [Actinosynnema sp. NPDC047251]|uniref:Uncharacterized protein n=1 Tax=Saccharothrix espanaensis (strain ATCC 51144 / DSM 44229 / JCM 9112 / NBRC 15066 / NRRL 15764) TaxID=1179773 RepID=K0JX43_SACES|nr:hypothetical protein [Saccharothrix espanaensis]CCH28798.1 hypothetical protein BN6_14750 [Saccharothrix espanaensis DSM 44229]
MAGWTAMAGEHDFDAGDEDAAREIAQALAAYGFPFVTGRKVDERWVVSALDEGPYATDVVGQRQIDAVGRAAAVVVRRWGGVARGGARFDVSRVAARRAGGLFVIADPGRRPPVPDVVMTGPPPGAHLPSEPDEVDEAAWGTFDFPGLDDVDWASLEHAHGSAEDVPDLLRALAEPDEDWDDALDELIGDDVLHQGTCYSSTLPALRFLARLAASGTLPFPGRHQLLLTLLHASGQWIDSLFAATTADDPTEDDERLPVDAELLALLDRWDAEPPAGRFLLACLAALHPGPGRRIADRVGELAASCAGTAEGECLALAGALLAGDAERALALAAGIVGWNAHCDPEWLEEPGTTAALRASRVLAVAALGTR